MMSKSKEEKFSSFQFPWKLHDLLSEAETNGNDTIISWLPGINAFKVHNRQRFTTEILPKYFSATKYKSFQRNLNFWGFAMITDGPDKGACYHSLFVRNDRERCQYMRREKLKSDKEKQGPPISRPTSPRNTPNKAVRQASVFADMISTKLNPSQSVGAHEAEARHPSLGSSGPSSFRDLMELSFPEKLHHFLSKGHYHDCVEWTQDGRCIRIIDPFRFQERVVPVYFPHSSFSAFLIELESFGFQKVTYSGYHQCYYHDMVVRGCRHLCKYIATPEAAKGFVSKDPTTDLSTDENSTSQFARETQRVVDMEVGTTNLPRLAGLLPGLQEPEILRHYLRREQQQQQQRHNILAGLLNQLDYQGHGRLEGATNILSTPFLPRVHSRNPALAMPLLNPDIVDSSQNRSAITNFLSNRSAFRGGEGGDKKETATGASQNKGPFRSP